MKKNQKSDAGEACVLTKILRIMRLSVFFSLFFIAQTWATSIYSQQTRLSLNMNNVKVKDVLTEIEKNSEFYFFFTEKLVDVDRSVSINVQNSNIDEILQNLFQSSNVTYKIFDRQIILNKRDNGVNYINGDSKTITGKVIDSTGSPLPGVSVIIKGTTKGTITDVNGSYSLSNVPENASLLFSFVGMKGQEIKVEGKSKINVTLVDDAIGIDEVVAVGYGTTVKREMIGAASSVKSGELAQSKNNSFDVALQGRAAGVQVSQASGEPGSSSRVLVRGTSSISAGSEPLYVVDGFPIYQEFGALSAINPEDIETIDVLKDAAATAIYGSRGANGVIIVTTKSGKKGKGETKVDYSFGVSNPTNMVKMMNAKQLLNVIDQGWKNDGMTTVWDPRTDGKLLSSYSNINELTRTIIEDVANKGGTDWLSPIKRQGVTKTLNLSSSKGFQDGQYYISGIYRNDEGILDGNDREQIGLKVNVDFKPVSWLTTGVKSNFTKIRREEVVLKSSGGATGGGRNDQGSRGGLGSAVGNALPFLPIYSYVNPQAFWDPLGGLNTVAANSKSDRFIWEDQYRIITNTFAQIDITKGFNLRAEGAIDFLQSKTGNFTSERLRYKAANITNYAENRNWNFTTYANYKKSFKDQSIDATLGVERFGRKLWQGVFMAEGILTSDQNLGEPPVMYTQNGTNQTNVLIMYDGTYPEFRMSSYFGRLNYNYKEKYLAGFSFRRDGASVFGPENIFGSFPAVSLGWIASEEDFFKDIKEISLLKLRASYGKTGNANIPGNIVSGFYATWPAYGSGSGVKMDVLPNEKVTWENILTLDAALEFGLYKNRISGSIGFYDKNISDMLLKAPIPMSIGMNDSWANIGKITNNGIELQLRTVNVQTKDFSWVTDFNLGTSKTKVEALTPALEKGGKGLIMGSTLTRVGSGLAEYFIPEYAGLNENGDPLMYVVDKNKYTETGITERMKAKNGSDSTMVVNEGLASANRFIKKGKSGLPTFYGGLTNTLQYKGMELSFLFTFQGGNYILDEFERSQIKGGALTNKRAELVDNYWTPTNKEARFPRLSYNNRDITGKINTDVTTDMYLYKGDFVRLKNIQLAYNLPNSVTSRLNIQGMRVYLNATNLFTLTKYKGYDPEMANLSSDVASRNLNQGIVGGMSYPQIKTFTAGVSFTF